GLIVAPDYKKIWIFVSSTTSGYYTGAYRLDDPEGNGSYVIGAIGLGSSTANRHAYCRSTRFDNKAYCAGRIETRSIGIFNIDTETWESSAVIPIAGDDSSGLLNVGSANDRLLAIYSKN